MDLEITEPLPWQHEQWQRLLRQFDSGQMAHAYLLCGAGGLGKRHFIQQFARLMLCRDSSPAVPEHASPSPGQSAPQSEPQPTPHPAPQPTLRQACGLCSNCLLGANAQHPDILLVQSVDGSKNIKIEQIRDLSNFAIHTSHSGGAKILLINQAEKLNTNAANALLKTLEEPTRNTYLFLLSDQPEALPLTVRSRCQRLLFNVPPQSISEAWLRPLVADKLADASLQDLLLTAQGRPLLALELLGSDAFVNKQQFISELTALAKRQSSIAELVKMASNIGELTALRYLGNTSSILIKYLLTNRRPDDADELTEALYALFEASGLATQALAMNLMGFYTEVRLASKQLSSSTNPNPQLLMESLLWRWSRLLHA